MIKRFVIAAILLISSTNCFSQINYSDHVKAVELSNSAIQKINSDNNIEAINLLKSAIKLDSTLRNSFIALNQACLNLNDYSTLEIYLKKAIEIFIEDDEFIYYLGNLYQKQDSINAAIEQYTEAIRLSKINGEDYSIVYAYYLNRGNCFVFKEDYVKAIQDFNYGIKLNPKGDALYTNKASLLYQLGNKNQACTQWKIAADLGNKDAKKYLDKYCN